MEKKTSINSSFFIRENSLMSENLSKKNSQISNSFATNKNKSTMSSKKDDDPEMKDSQNPSINQKSSEEIQFIERSLSPSINTYLRAISNEEQTISEYKTMKKKKFETEKELAIIVKKMNDNNNKMENLKIKLKNLKEEKSKKKIEIVNSLSNKESLEEVYKNQIYYLKSRISSKSKNKKKKSKSKNKKVKDKTKTKNNNINNENFDNVNENENDNIKKSNNNNNNSNLNSLKQFSSTDEDDFVILIDEIKEVDIKKYIEQVINMVEDIFEGWNHDKTSSLTEIIENSFSSFNNEISNSPFIDTYSVVSKFFLKISLFISNQSLGKYSETLINLFLRYLLKINSINIKLTQSIKFVNKKYKDLKNTYNNQIATLMKKNSILESKKNNLEKINEDLDLRLEIYDKKEPTLSERNNAKDESNATFYDTLKFFKDFLGNSGKNTINSNKVNDENNNDNNDNNNNNDNNDNIDNNFSNNSNAINSLEKKNINNYIENNNYLSEVNENYNENYNDNDNEHEQDNNNDDDNFNIIEECDYKDKCFENNISENKSNRRNENKGNKINYFYKKNNTYEDENEKIINMGKDTNLNNSDILYNNKENNNYPLEQDNNYNRNIGNELNKNSNLEQINPRNEDKENKINNLNNNLNIRNADVNNNIINETNQRNNTQFQNKEVYKINNINNNDIKIKNSNSNNNKRNNNYNSNNYNNYNNYSIKDEQKICQDAEINKRKEIPSIIMNDETNCKNVGIIEEEFIKDNKNNFSINSNTMKSKTEMYNRNSTFNKIDEQDEYSEETINDNIHIKDKNYEFTLGSNKNIIENNKIISDNNRTNIINKDTDKEKGNINENNKNNLNFYNYEKESLINKEDNKNNKNNNNNNRKIVSNNVDIKNKGNPNFLNKFITNNQVQSQNQNQNKIASYNYLEEGNLQNEENENNNSNKSFDNNQINNNNYPTNKNEKEIKNINKIFSIDKVQNVVDFCINPKYNNNKGKEKYKNFNNKNEINNYNNNNNKKLEKEQSNKNKIIQFSTNSFNIEFSNKNNNEFNIIPCKNNNNNQKNNLSDENSANNNIYFTISKNLDNKNNINNNNISNKNDFKMDYLKNEEINISITPPNNEVLINTNNDNQKKIKKQIYYNKKNKGIFSAKKNKFGKIQKKFYSQKEQNNTKFNNSQNNPIGNETKNFEKLTTKNNSKKIDFFDDNKGNNNINMTENNIETNNNYRNLNCNNNNTNKYEQLNNYCNNEQNSSSNTNRKEDSLSNTNNKKYELTNGENFSLRKTEYSSYKRIRNNNNNDEKLSNTDKYSDKYYHKLNKINIGLSLEDSEDKNGNNIKTNTNIKEKDNNSYGNGIIKISNENSLYKEENNDNQINSNQKTYSNYSIEQNNNNIEIINEKLKNNNDLKNALFNNEINYRCETRHIFSLNENKCSSKKKRNNNPIVPKPREKQKQYVLFEQDFNKTENKINYLNNSNINLIKSDDEQNDFNSDNNKDINNNQNFPNKSMTTTTLMKRSQSFMINKSPKMPSNSNSIHHKSINKIDNNKSLNISGYNTNNSKKHKKDLKNSSNKNRNQKLKIIKIPNVNQNSPEMEVKMNNTDELSNTSPSYISMENNSTSYELNSKLQLLSQKTVESFCYFKILGKNSSKFNPLNNYSTNPEKMGYFEGHISIDISLGQLKIIPKVFIGDKKIPLSSVLDTFNPNIATENSISYQDNFGNEEQITNNIKDLCLCIQLKEIAGLQVQKHMLDIVKIRSAFIKCNLNKMNDNTDVSGKNKRKELNINKFIYTKEIYDIPMDQNDKIKAAFCNFFAFTILFGKKNYTKIECIFINNEDFNNWLGWIESIIEVNNDSKNEFANYQSFINQTNSNSLNNVLNFNGSGSIQEDYDYQDIIEKKDNYVNKISKSSSYKCLQSSKK